MTEIGTSVPLPQRPGWFARNWFWFVPIIAILPVLACGGFGVAGIFALRQAVLKTPGFQQAMTALRADPQVREALGEPIEHNGWQVSFAINNGRAATTTLSFRVKGPKNNARVTLESSQAPGQPAKLTRLEATPDGQPMIRLIKPELKKAELENAEDDAIDEDES